MKYLIITLFLALACGGGSETPKTNVPIEVTEFTITSNLFYYKDNQETEFYVIQSANIVKAGAVLNLQGTSNTGANSFSLYDTVDNDIIAGGNVIFSTEKISKDWWRNNLKLLINNEKIKINDAYGVSKRDKRIMFYRDDAELWPTWYYEN